MKKLTFTLLAAAALLGSMPTRAQAVFIFTLSQVGNDVILTGAGSLNFTGLTNAGNITQSAEIFPKTALLIGGPTTPTTGINFSGLGGPPAFGNGNFTYASSGSGDFVGI